MVEYVGMLYRILNYNKFTKVAEGVQSSRYDPNGSTNNLRVSLLSKRELEPGRCYSFRPINEFVGQDFVRGELDYAKPF